MRLDQPPRDGQPETEPAGPRIRRAIEPREDALLVAMRQAGAAIRDGDDDVLAIAPRADYRRFMRGAVRRGIVKKSSSSLASTNSQRSLERIDVRSAIFRWHHANCD